MDNDFVTRREFEEYKKRLDDKKNDWDDDLAEVKTEVKELRELTNAVSKLAQNMENMMKEQERTSGRLDAIEKRGGKLLWQIVGYLLTAGVGFVLVALLRRAGIF